MKKLLLASLLSFPLISHAQYISPYRMVEPPPNTYPQYYPDGSFKPIPTYVTYNIDLQVLKNINGKWTVISRGNFDSKTNTGTPYESKNSNSLIELNFIPVEGVDNNTYLSLGYKFQEYKNNKVLQIKAFKADPTINYPITKTLTGTDLIRLNFKPVRQPGWASDTTGVITLLNDKEYMIKATIQRRLY